MKFVVGDRVRHKHDLTDILGTVTLVDSEHEICHVEWDSSPDPADTPYHYSVLLSQEITPA